MSDEELIRPIMQILATVRAEGSNDDRVPEELQEAGWISERRVAEYLEDYPKFAPESLQPLVNRIADRLVQAGRIERKKLDHGPGPLGLNVIRIVDADTTT